MSNLNEVAILRALNGKERLFPGSFLLRPMSNGGTIICGVADERLIVGSQLDQVWVGRIVLFPLVKRVDRKGKFVSLPLSHILTLPSECVEEWLEVTYRAPDCMQRELLMVGGIGDVTSFLCDGNEKFADGGFLVRATNDENGRTILCGHVPVNLMAGEPVEDNLMDRVWSVRMLLIPSMRFEDRDEAFGGMLPQQVLCSGINPATFHRLD